MTAWLKQPLLLTRRAFLAIGLVVGLSIVAAIGIATKTVSDLRTERERAIHAETFSKGEIVQLVTRVAKLEKPSALELDYRIRVGLERCLRSPGCLRDFRRIVRVVKRGGRFVVVTGAASKVPAPADHTPATQQQTPPGSPSQPGRPGNPSPGPAPSPAPSPSPSPAPRPSPRPNIPLPVPGLGVCTPIVGVNCP